MRAKFIGFYAALVACFVGLPCLELRAEFLCAAEVSYTWLRSPPPTESVAVKGQQQVVAAPTSAPSLVLFIGVERSAVDEATAKSTLQNELNRQRAKASDSCRRDHEGFGECVATKLSSRSSILNSLSFSTRVELERALMQECREQQGVCGTVEASEPKCRELAITKGAAGAPGDKKTDAKKPESKKK